MTGRMDGFHAPSGESLIRVNANQGSDTTTASRR